MIPTITIHEVTDALGYKDVRSAEKFCKANNLKIFSVQGTHIKKVIKAEFEFAWEKDIIRYLKEKFGEEHWLNAYQQYANLNLLSLDGEERKNEDNFSDRYKPQGDKEKKYLLDFKSTNANMADPMDKSFFIPKNKRIRGLQVVGFCQHCKKNLTRDFCDENKKSLKNCPHIDSQYYKIYAFPPGGGNKRKTKRLNATNWEDAIKEGLDFKKEVKTGSKNKNLVEEKNKSDFKEKDIKPVLLVDCIAKYLSFLSGENVPLHRKRERSSEYLSEVKRSLKCLCECMQKNGHDVSSFTINDLSDEVAGQVFDFLLKEKNYSNRTFNKTIGFFTSFISWCNSEMGYSLKNWFEQIKRKSVNSNAEIISKEEFEQLLKQVTEENGIKEYTEGKKRLRNLYHPWLADGFRLGLETGRRREEIIKLKFSDIVENRGGIPEYIKSEDFKVNRIQNRITEEEKKYIFIPVTASLHKLLLEMGYEKFKGENKYILAPEIKERDRQMKDALSRGFSHYYSQLNTGRKLEFKSLRKTYITGLVLHLGGGAKLVSGHSDDKVIEQHYLSKEAVAKAARSFSVFSNGDERKKELAEVRDNKIKKQKISLER